MIKFFANYISGDKVRKETFWAFTARIISIMAGLFILYFVPKYFGIENYGSLTLIISYISIFEIIFGNSINPVIKKELSEHKFSEKGANFFVNGFKIKSLLFLLGFCFAYVFLLFIKIPILNNNFWGFVALLFLMNFWGLVINCFEAAHRTFFTAIMYFLEYFIVFSLLLLYYFNGHRSLSALLTIFIVGYVLSFGYGIIALLFKLKINLSSLISPINIDIAKKFLRGAFYLSLASASFVILTRIDSIMLSFMASIEDVGFYNIASELTRNAAIVSTALIVGVIPLFVKSNQIILFWKTVKKIALINLIIFCAFFFLSDFLVKTIYGPGFEQVSLLIKILGIYPLLISLQGFTSEILILKEKSKYIFVNGVLAVILNIFLNYILIKSIGAPGAAIATISAYAFWFTLNYIKVVGLI